MRQSLLYVSMQLDIGDAQVSIGSNKFQRTVENSAFLWCKRNSKSKYQMRNIPRGLPSSISLCKCLDSTYSGA